MVKVTGSPAPAVTSAASLGIELEAMHPGSNDAEMRSWFIARGSGDEADVVETVRTVPGVEAAYVKPGASPA